MQCKPAFRQTSCCQETKLLFVMDFALCKHSCETMWDHKNVHSVVGGTFLQCATDSCPEADTQVLLSSCISADPTHQLEQTEQEKT